MNTELYLKKLNLPKKSPSLEYLNELIAAHQKTISFNNLSVFFRPGVILNLELEPLFEKVIVRNEGGYCFENNKVFYYLLKDLGFVVEPKAGRVILNRPGDFPRTHRISIVSFGEDRYLADVGFGKDVPRRALKIGATQTSGHHVIKDGNLYRHQLLKPDLVFELYTFDDSHFEESDFTMGNFFTNTHPQSHFRNDVIVARHEDDMVEFISNKIYSKIQNGERTDNEIKNWKDFLDYLKRFGIQDLNYLETDMWSLVHS